jgi:hypothetical protein
MTVLSGGYVFSGIAVGTSGFADWVIDGSLTVGNGNSATGSGDFVSDITLFDGTVVGLHGTRAFSFNVPYELSNTGNFTEVFVGGGAHVGAGLHGPVTVDIQFTYEGTNSNGWEEGIQLKGTNALGQLVAQADQVILLTPTSELPPIIQWLGLSGDFANGVNWGGGVVPSGAEVLINGSGTYTVTSAADETVNSLATASGVTLDITGGMFTFLNGTDSGANAGTIEVGAAGTLLLAGSFANNGVLAALGGSIDVSGAITGPGAVQIGSNGLLDLSGGSVAGGVQFVGIGGELILDTGTNQIGGTITGAVADTIDLTFQSFAAGDQAVWQQSGSTGILSIETSTGSVLETLSFSGQYTSSDFTPSSDNQGGTLITALIPADVPAQFPFTNDILSQVEALFVGYFARGGDPSGLNYWAGQLNAGNISLGGEAASFSVQAESQAEYPFLANPANATTAQVDSFITSVYQNLFDRAPDPAGSSYWETQLSANLGNPLYVGSFIMAVIYGAQNTDQTTIVNKVTVADFLTTELAAANISFSTAAAALAHTVISATTSDPSTVAAEETAITSFISTQANGAEIGVLGISAVSLHA